MDVVTLARRKSSLAKGKGIMTQSIEPLIYQVVQVLLVGDGPLWASIYLKLGEGLSLHNVSFIAHCSPLLLDTSIIASYHCSPLLPDTSIIASYHCSPLLPDTSIIASYHCSPLLPDTSRLY